MISPEEMAGFCTLMLIVAGAFHIEAKYYARMAKLDFDFHLSHFKFMKRMKI